MNNATVNIPATATTDRRRWIALWTLAAGLAMIVLDGTIVGVALPTIINDLRLDLTDAQWINSLYNVVFAALLLTMGRVGDRLGRRSLFLTGIALFLIGSVLAALSAGASALILARVVQGVGGAMILPSTLSTVNATFRGKDRAAAFGVWGAVMSGSAALGPLLGGWLTESFAWQWIFWVNVPLGLAILVAAVLVVPQTHGAPARRGVDVDGLLTSGIGFGALVFALIEGNQLGWWSPREPLTVFGVTWPATAPVSVVPVAALVGVIFIGLFVLWERHRARVRRDALLDLSLFRTPTFAWGNLTAAMVAIGEFALVLILPLYLVNALGLGVLHTGLVLAAMALGAFFSGAGARHLACRLGAPMVVTVGLLLELLGVVGVSLTVWRQSPAWLLALPLVVYGIGLGLASAQLTSTVLQDIPTEQSGAGSATQSTVRQLGSALGSALGGTALAVTLHQVLPGRLAAVGLDPAQVDAFTRQITDSAGGILHAARAGTLPLGPNGLRVIDAMTDAFATASAWATGSAAVFLTLGLLGSLAVQRASARSLGR
ncbi:DHA2 family efflux MFS transporter permease subunit [Enemella dayhoffiae]|nr:DHA2 family efflux MFS transporter permease subunit [Enemella dayhoffiae]